MIIDILVLLLIFIICILLIIKLSPKIVNYTMEQFKIF
jgi:hypothetical protein